MKIPQGEDSFTFLTYEVFLSLNALLYFIQFCFVCWSVYATNTDCMTRIVNDAPDKYSNCVMKNTIIDGIPYIVLFSTKVIACGEELRYSYEPKSLAWRNKVSTFFIICILYYNILEYFAV